jgi:signal transduction histidine kinase
MTVTPEIFRRFKAFESFTDKELAEIAKLTQEKSCQPGMTLFSESTPAEKLYLILEGKISLEKKVQLSRSGSSRQATVSIQGPGQMAGWTSIVAPHVYTLSGVCLEPAKLLVLDGQDIQRFIAEDPEAGLKFMAIIATIIRQRMEATTGTLTYFLSIISHELKSPLAAVENYMEIMLGGFVGELTDKQKKMLSRSALRLKDLRTLINDILDLARMQPEHIQADFDWFDPIEIGTEAIENVQLMAKEKDVKVRVQAPPGLPKMVGARRRLRQVFSNLLSNAIKFSPKEGKVTLTAQDEPDQLVVEITDEGIGILADEQAHIFEDFYRGQNVGEASGAGLGLSIVKKIIEAHRGKIWVESPYVPGKSGTKFTVVIPKNLNTPAMKQAEWKREETK